MELPRPLANLVAFANTVDSKRAAKMITLSAIVVTPTEQIPLIMPTGMSTLCLYAANFADDLRISAQIQPGIYLNKILPNKDNLFIEVIERQGLTQTKKRFRAVPLGDSNPEMAGNNSALANLASKDSANMATVKFQMFEVGYAILRNQMVSDSHLMSTLHDVLHYQLSKFGREKLANLTGADAFKGVDIEKPIDNDRVFKQIIIPSAVPLVRLASWLQNHPEFGIYSKGLGSYYQKGLWRIGPLFKVGRYDQATAVLNIYRLPENIVPTLSATHFTQGKVTTILSTGQAKHIDGLDIKKQNVGTGKRILSPDAVMGETGYYYGKGQAIATRQDSLSEYQTSKRASGEEMAPFEAEPSNNLCKPLSQNSFNEGTVETIRWHNSDKDKLVPFMPVRFFFMSGDVLKYKEGTLLAARTELDNDTEGPGLNFREHTALSLFLNNTETNAE